MKTIKEFNKEFAMKILQLQKKREKFLNKKIEEYCLAKNLKIQKLAGNFEIVNIEYIEELLKKQKIKLISEYSTYLDKVKIYKFEELKIINYNNKNYKVLLAEELIDLSDFNCNQESIEDFLNYYL